MNSYIDLLGAHDMERHDHLIIKTKPIIEDNNVIIEFENDYIITNCYYFKEAMYGVLLYPLIIEENKVTFQIHNEDNKVGVEEAKEINEFEIGDKLGFFSRLGFGEYQNKELKYAEL